MADWHNDSTGAHARVGGFYLHVRRGEKSNYWCVCRGFFHVCNGTRGTFDEAKQAAEEAAQLEADGEE